jgi:hypothetical protein
MQRLLYSHKMKRNSLTEKDTNDSFLENTAPLKTGKMNS